MICIKLQQITLVIKFLGPHVQPTGGNIPIEELFQEPGECVSKNVIKF